MTHPPAAFFLETFQHGLRLAGDPRLPMAEREGAARLVASLCNAAFRPSEEVLTEIFAATARTIAEPAILEPLIGAMRGLVPDPGADAARRLFVGALWRLAERAADAGALPQLGQLVDLAFPLDPDRQRAIAWLKRALELLATEDPRLVAHWLRTWSEAPEVERGWVREWLTRHPDVVDAADFLARVQLHLVLPTPESWTRLASCPNRPPPALLQAASYSDLVHQSLASLNSAAERAPDASVARVLQAWADQFRVEVHLAGPSASSWQELAVAATGHGSDGERPLDPAEYGGRASQAFASLCSATEDEPEGTVRRMLGEWLVVFAERASAGGRVEATPTLANMSERLARRLLGVRAFLRGQALRSAGQVQVEGHTDTSATGRVGEHVVSLRFVPGRLEQSCSCSVSPRPPCAHVAALLISARHTARSSGLAGTLLARPSLLDSPGKP